MSNNEIFYKELGNERKGKVGDLRRSSVKMTNNKREYLFELY